MLFVGLGLILAAAMVVAMPLWRGAEPAIGATAEGDVAFRWEKQKRDAYAAIRDAEMDLGMGKLASEDYEAIRTVEEARAIEALRELGAGPATVTATSRRAESRCAGCGKVVGAAAYCAACGKAVKT